MKVNVVKSVLKANDLVAARNRDIFKEANILALNLISSPGSGKTTLLEKTIPLLGAPDVSIVVVGDLKTTRDAERLTQYAKQVTQINTGMSCHLYANQIAQSISELDLVPAQFFFIENVGNMVCPGEFDLGENVKVVLLSIPEGDDKVAKYPTIFRAADIVLLTKSDLRGALSFDTERVTEDIRKLNDKAPIMHISATNAEGMDVWITWLKEQYAASRGQQAKFITQE